MKLLILTWMTMDIMILIQIIHLMKDAMDLKLEKDNMLSQLRNYYDEDELESE